MKSSVLSPASFFDKVVIWLLVLSQILKTYGTVSYWNFASIPTYILGLVFLFLVISKKRTFRLGTSMPKECFIFFAYWAIVHILTNQGSVIPYNTIEAALMFVLFWGVVTYEQFPRLVKYYTWTDARTRHGTRNARHVGGRRRTARKGDARLHARLGRRRPPAERR